MNEDLKRENTNEITCPHCDYEFGDSWECIPRDENGEVDWKEKCPDCKKEFNVSFDSQNVDDGFTSRVLTCEGDGHSYELRNKLHKSDSDWRKKEYISTYSRIDVCSICDDYRFTPVKPDGSDFTKQEFLDFKIKKRLAAKPKMYHKFDGIKTGSIKVRDKSKVEISTDNEEGNVTLWVELCRWMISRGYMPTKTLSDFLRKNAIELKKDWIECTVSVTRNGITVAFYQNEIFKTRKLGDGRYEHGIYDILTTQMKLKFRSAINTITSRFAEKGFATIKIKSDLEILLSNLKVDKLEDWVDPTNHSKRDYEDRDKNIMKSGDLKYFYDRKVLKKGIIYWNNGNQWCILNSGVLYRTSHWDLFDYNDDPRRKPLSKDAQVQRLYTELSKAEKAHSYDRCKVLWGKLESYKLYNVYSIKHGNWWAGNNGGYVSDQANAGVYTHENIMANQGYYNDGVDSKAVLINN